MKHLDLFSGIGGFALASEWAFGKVEHIFCDNEPFAQAILKKHWPEAKIYGDIKELRGGSIGAVDLVTGGFPCQPFSGTGKRRGTEDERHLWPEMLRTIQETHPKWVIGENVSGLLTWNEGLVLDTVFDDLEANGYEAWAFVIPACSVGAPHRRDRVWIVANSNTRGDRRHERSGIQESTTPRAFFPSNWLQAATELRGVDDGLSNRVDRFRKLGNSIVPQVAYEIMCGIRDVELSTVDGKTDGHIM